MLRDDLRSRALALLRAERQRDAEPAATDAAESPPPPPAMRYCPACGAGVRPKDRFCASCGERLEAAEPERDAAP